MIVWCQRQEGRRKDCTQKKPTCNQHVGSSRSSREACTISRMAHTSRDTAAQSHGDFSSQTRGIVEFRPPGSEPSPSAPNYLTCQLLEQLQPALQTLAVWITRTVEIASLLHFANGGATVSLIHGSLARVKTTTLSRPIPGLRFSFHPNPLSINFLSSSSRTCLFLLTQSAHSVCGSIKTACTFLMWSLV